jgi:hypothetical protein
VILCIPVGWASNAFQVAANELWPVMEASTPDNRSTYSTVATRTMQVLKGMTPDQQTLERIQASWMLDLRTRAVLTLERWMPVDRMLVVLRARRVPRTQSVAPEFAARASAAISAAAVLVRAARPEHVWLAAQARAACPFVPHCTDVTGLVPRVPTRARPGPVLSDFDVKRAFA